jgi:hypothetical protein
MRRRFLRGLVAAGLAVAIGTAGTVQPARADVPGDVTFPPAGPTVSLFFTIWRLIHNPSSSEVEALVQLAVGAVNDAENQIISHMDALEAARATADARSLGREFLNYPVIRQSWAIYTLASNANRAAALDYEDLKKINGAAADEIGHAAELLYPIAMAAAQDAGWTEAARAALRNEYRQVNELMVQKLEPTCSPIFTDNDAYTYTKTWQCTAADGNSATATESLNKVTGQWISPPVNVDQLKVDAAVHSSWLTAVRVLPTLRNP